MMDEDGTVLKEKFEKILSDLKVEQKIKDLYGKCYNVSTDKDPCNKAFEIFQCLDENNK